MLHRAPRSPACRWSRGSTSTSRASARGSDVRRSTRSVDRGVSAGRPTERGPCTKLARSPTGRSSQWPEDAETVDVGCDQIRAESREHVCTVVPLTKFSSGDLQQSANVATEALRRAVVEVVRHVRNRKARIFEQPRGTDETRHGQIAFRGRNTGPKESAHERARS